MYTCSSTAHISHTQSTFHFRFLRLNAEPTAPPVFPYRVIMRPSTACETQHIYGFDLHRARLNYQIICALFLTRIICIGGGGQLKLAPAAQYNIIRYYTIIYVHIHIVGSRLSTVYYYIGHVKAKRDQNEGAVTRGVWVAVERRGRGKRSPRARSPRCRRNARACI